MSPGEGAALPIIAERDRKQDGEVYTVTSCSMI